MEYGRLEMILVGGGWSRGVVVRGAVSGTAVGVQIDTANWHVINTIVTNRSARKMRLSRAQMVASGTSGNQSSGEVVQVSLKSAVRGPNGPIGSIARIWVSRADGSITHLLINAHFGGEQIVPLNLIQSIGPTGVCLKIDKEAARQLFQYRPDEELATEVRMVVAAALANPRARRDVKIHVFDGEAMLAGEVDTVDQMRQVERAARAVTGVRAVTNDLVVQESLAATVESLLLGALGESLNDADVRVFAEHGIVHLEGNVSSARQRSDIERLTLNANGVRVVVNHLQVDGEPPDRSAGTGPLVRNR